VACGTTGEAPTLTDAETASIFQTVVQQAHAGGMRVVAGTGSNSTRKSLEATARAKELGADACLIVAPYYNKPTPPGLLSHFKALDEVGIPLIVYNIPGRTGINIAPDTLEAIARACPNVVGLKASNGDLEQITETASRVRQLGRPFSILSGDDALTLPILAVGGAGVVSVAANFMPKAMAGLVEAYSKGQTDLACRVAHAIHSACGALLRFGSNPSPVKAAMNRLGLPVGGCRLPLVALDAETTDRLLSVLRVSRQQLEALDIPLDDALARL
jgi:4-hydroxy-tetrahydrodipicolinate synthase